MVVPIDSLVQPQDPVYRASLLKSALAHARERDSSFGTDIVTRMDPALVQLINAAARTEWLHLERMLDLDEAVFAAGGAEGYQDFWRTFAANAVNLPVLGGLAKLALRLMATPTGLLKQLPRSYEATTRNLGEGRLEKIADSTYIVRYVDVPDMSRPELYAYSQQAALYVVFDLVNVKGTCTLLDTPPHEVAVRVSW